MNYFPLNSISVYCMAAFLLASGQDSITMQARFAYPLIPGWTISDTVKTFSPDNLYRFIDGAADGYLAMEFDSLTVAYYTRSDSTVTVEIYRHKTDRDAYGIYSQERSSSVEYLGVGIEGYYAEHVLNFVRGNAYIKLTGSNLGENDRRILLTTARAISNGIGGTTSRPEILSCLPLKNLVPHTERYLGRNFLGYQYFHSTFVADYQTDSVQYQIFIITGDDPDDTETMWKSYLQSNNRLSDIERTDMVAISDRYQGTLFIQHLNGYIIGTVGQTDPRPASMVLEQIRNSLHKSGKTKG